MAKRTLGDIGNDLNTIRKGSMPTGAPAPRPKPVTDPIEEQRVARLGRRNRGDIKDVNLPAPKSRR